MNHLLVDYLTISFKFTDELKTFILSGLDEKEQIYNSAHFDEYFKTWIFDKLHLPVDKLQSIKSRYGYSFCFYFDGITVHIDESILLLDMSGKGCRTCEDLNKGFDWYIFIHQFDDMIRFRTSLGDAPPVHIARLDIAYDDIGNKIVTVPLLQKYIRKKFYVSRVGYVSNVDGTQEQAIYFGSPKSDRRLRIYDKRMEQRGLESDIPWVRYEFQLRDVNALSFYLNLCACKGDFSTCYFGVLSDFVTFTNKSRLDVGHHSERLEPVKWWSALVGNVLKLKQLYIPGREYTLKSIQDYFETQCLSAAKAIMLNEFKKTGDFSSFLQMVNSAELNEKQKSVLGDIGDCITVTPIEYDSFENIDREVVNEYKRIREEYKNANNRINS